MNLTTKQAKFLQRARALVDANPNDKTTKMNIVRGLIGIVEAQDEQLTRLLPPPKTFREHLQDMTRPEFDLKLAQWSCWENIQDVTVKGVAIERRQTWSSYWKRPLE